MGNTECLKLAFIILSIAGIWIPKYMQKHYMKKVFYVIYSFIPVVFILMGMICLQLNFLCMFLGDINKMIEASVLLHTNLVQVFKIVTIVLQRRRIDNLLNITNDLQDEKNIMQHLTKKLSKFAYYFVSGSFGTVLLWCITPALKPHITLPIDYPHFEERNIWYILCYIYQTCGLMISALPEASADVLTGGLMVFAAGQLKLLQNRMEDIGKKRKNKNKSKDIQYNRNRTDNRIVLQGGDFEDIVEFVQAHQNVISFVNEITSVFGVALFVQFLLSGILLCESAYILSTSSVITECATMLLYLLCLLVQLHLYCFCGELIRTESDQLVASVYNYAWEDNTIPVRKALLLVMTKGHKNLTVTACNMFELSFATFTTVLRTSYSYFALIRSKN